MSTLHSKAACFSWQSFTKQLKRMEKAVPPDCVCNVSCDSMCAEAQETAAKYKDRFEGMCALAQYLCIEANDARRYRKEETINCDDVCLFEK